MIFKIKHVTKNGRIFSWLQVNLSPDVTNFGIRGLSRLVHLRYFLFSEDMGDDYWEQEQKFLVLCLQYLPRLNVVGRSFDSLQVHESCHWNFTLSIYYHNYLLQQQQQHMRRICLKHLIISNDVKPLENFELPELEALTLWVPYAGDVLGLCKRFPTILSLGLYHSTEDVVLALLQIVGQRLHTLLNSAQPYQTRFLAQVFQWCPNLRRLNLSTCVEATFLQLWPKNFYSPLEEVILYTTGNANLPPGFFVQV